MNTEHPVDPSLSEQPARYPLTARFRLTARWLSGWMLRGQLRRLDRDICTLQQQLAGEFATLETQALHDDLASAQARRAALADRLIAKP